MSSKLWLVQGDEENQWLFAHDWQILMCTNASSGKSNCGPLYTSKYPAWAAKHSKYVFVCTRDGGFSLEDPPSPYYILNLTTGRRRYMKMLEEHKGAKDTGSFAIDAGESIMANQHKLPTI
jgi:hypothetical protein